MDSFYILVCVVALYMFLKLYPYSWLVISSNRNKKQIERRIRSRKFGIFTSKRNIKLSVRKSETIENGAKINHYIFSDGTSHFEVNGPIQSLDTMYYESGIDNFVDCELYESVITFDGIEINSIINLHRVMGLDDSYVIVPKGILNNRNYVEDSFGSFCWPSKICFADELLWEDPCGKDKLFALNQLEVLWKNVFIVKNASLSSTFLPMKYHIYFMWYRKYFNIRSN